MLSDLTDSSPATLPPLAMPAVPHLASGAPAHFCRLRPDLRFTLQESAGKPFYLVEDPYHGRFYRIGPSEWRLACQLDGKTALPQAIAQLSAEGNATEWTSERAASLCGWLVQSHLATVTDPQGREVTTENSASQCRAVQRSSWNPFSIKLPLLRPDRAVSRLHAWCHLLLSRPAVLLWVAVCIYGLYLVASDWPRFKDSAALYLAPETWVWLACVWIGLKMVHELFHGLVCKHFGGFVSEAGIVFLLFSPVAYVDVTSSWQFRDKWARIFTSAAGMYAEFGMAAVAAIVWSYTDTGTVNYVCHSIVLTASITTLLFNANPLMRFDGYYIFADLMEIQNLYSLGRQASLSFWQRAFFGPTAVAGRHVERARWLVTLYGLAASVWRVMVSVGMLIASAALFHGAGVVLALFGAVTWFAIPGFNFVRRIMQKEATPTISRGRLGLTALLAFTVMGCILAAPRPGGVTVPAIVAYANLQIVRAETRGFIEQVHVTEGEQVVTGKLLVTLRGDDIRAELRDIELQWEQSELRTRITNGDKDIAESQLEHERLVALTQRRDQLRKQVEELAVRARADGQVIDFHLDQLLGRFVEVGAPILRMATENQKEIHVSIPESSLDAFTKQLGSCPTIHVRGHAGAISEAPLAKVEPEANTSLRHAAWGAPHGGPLAVRQNNPQAISSTEETFRLLAPRFHGVIELPDNVAGQLRDGQVGAARLPRAYESIGGWAYRTIAAWAQGKHQARANS